MSVSKQVGFFFLALLTWPALCWPQGSAELFSKAPPHIDSALRERVKFFYQAHVDGKFRLADEAVHEDSKDAFFVADKNQYRDFEMVKIEYDEGFERAKVVVAVGTEFFMPPAGRMPVTMPLTTFWKKDGGQWWWYVIPPGEDGVDTPFGKMKAGPETDESSPYYRIQNMPSAEEILDQVRVSKTSVTLDCAQAGEDSITVSNGMPGAIYLTITDPEVQGLSVAVESKEVPGKEQRDLVFACEAREDLAGRNFDLILSIRPTGHQIPIRVKIAPAQ